jgi:Zn-finger nucleic acid-binding protein
LNKRIGLCEEEKSVQCPKCKNVTLLDGALDDKFAVKYCQECKGTWIPADEYEAWASRQPYNPGVPDLKSKTLNVNFVQSPFDTKAALCPECRRYLSRAKVNLTTPFYIERCMQCRGIWCDYGEWDILEKLGLHTTIEELFSNEWQAKTREQKFSEQERRATIDKLGSDVAAQVFALAEVLEKHPNGDFGVAYLMRRVAVNIQPADVRRNE